MLKIAAGVAVKLVLEFAGYSRPRYLLLNTVLKVNFFHTYNMLQIVKILQLFAEGGACSLVSGGR